MTSFLRTRKDRHPKPENKARSPRAHDPSGSHADPGETVLRGNGGLDDIERKSGETPCGIDHSPSSH